MKIRSGFVSNSSSSSFIVKIKKDIFDGHFDDDYKKNIVDENKINKLTEYGFGKSYNPYLTVGCNCNIEDFTNEELKYMIYNVGCNQDDTIQFLLKNNIPFKALVNNEHEYMIYKKDSDYLLKAFNYGSYIEVYEPDEHEIKCINKTKPIEKIPITDWLDSE